jgi:hypothetical protein
MCVFYRLSRIFTLITRTPLTMIRSIILFLTLCVVPAAFAQSYGLTVETVAEHSDGPLAGMTTYRVYMDCVYADDLVSSVSGDYLNPLSINTTTSFYQDPFGAQTPSAINPLLFGFFPELEFDSWLTIGISQQPNSAANEGEISAVESPTQSWIAQFEAGDSIAMTDTTGGAWYVTQNYDNGVAGDDLKVLLMQLTTDGEISGTILVQVFEHAVGSSDLRYNLSFDSDGGTGATGCMDPLAENYDVAVSSDDGSCVYGGCMDPTACNYDAAADVPDASCTFAELNRNCDGSCINDADADGICDEDELGGCMDAAAWNYDASATEDSGNCIYFNACDTPADLVVEAASFSFTPATASLPIGATVVWVNIGGLHNVNATTDQVTGLPFGNPQSCSI